MKPIPPFKIPSPELAFQDITDNLRPFLSPQALELLNTRFQSCVTEVTFPHLFDPKQPDRADRRAWLAYGIALHVQGEPLAPKHYQALAALFQAEIDAGQIELGCCQYPALITQPSSYVGNEWHTLAIYPFRARWVPGVPSTNVTWLPLKPDGTPDRLQCLPGIERWYSDVDDKEQVAIPNPLPELIDIDLHPWALYLRVTDHQGRPIGRVKSINIRTGRAEFYTRPHYNTAPIGGLPDLDKGPALITDTLANAQIREHKTGRVLATTPPHPQGVPLLMSDCPKTAPGFWCSRSAGHEGPCAFHPINHPLGG